MQQSVSSYSGGCLHKHYFSKQIHVQILKCSLLVSRKHIWRVYFCGVVGEEFVRLDFNGESALGSTWSFSLLLAV